MYCQNCGTFNSDESLFCEACGAKLERDEAVDVSSEQKIASSVKTEKINPSYAQPTSELTLVPATAPKQMQKIWIILTVEVVALLLIVFATIKIGKAGFSAERMAANYFVNMANADWKSAYDKLDVEESDFINEDMFAFANQYNSIGSINNYAVQDPKTDIDNLLNSSSGLGTVVDIDYRLKGNQSDSSYEVTLNKQSGKQLLFFDDWKVSTENLICNDYSIYLPEGATVVVDGITLDDSYLDDKAASEVSDYYTTNMVAYTIPKIFYGTHTITVSMDDYNDVKATIDIDAAGEYYVVNNLQLKSEVVAKLMQLAGEDMQKIYTSAMTGKSFSTIQGLFATDYSKDIEDSYNSLLSNLNENSSTTLNKIDFSNIKASASATSTDVSLEVDYSIQYNYQDWWSGEQQTDSYDDGETLKFSFIKENGNWVLTNLGCNTLYYW